jgi:hypothetical protein
MIVGLSADWTTDTRNAMSWLLNVTWCCVEIPIWSSAVDMKVCGKFFLSHIQRTFSLEECLEEELRLLSVLKITMERGANGLQECITGSEDLWLASIES